MKKLLCVCLIAAMLFTLAACGTNNATPSSEQVVLNVHINGDPVAIDPAFAYDNASSLVVNQITESLLTHNLDNSLKPNLCKSFEATDPCTYVYQIRDDVYFSDGTQMTMDDVIYSIQRHMDAEKGSLMNWFFANVVSVEATGDWEMTIKLSEPQATWKYVLATSAGMIVQKKFCEEHADDLGSASTGMIGTGPFVFDKWENGSKIVLKKNENYWDKTATTNVDEIVFSIITDDTTIATALKSGQVDFSWDFSNKLLDTIGSFENVELKSFNGMGIEYLAFNTMREPFNDVNVRKAIACAIDLDAICNNVVKEAGNKGGLLPMTDSLFTVEGENWKQYVEQIGGHVYDLSQAKAYLEKSSVPNGFDFTMYVSQARSQAYDVALVVQQNLKELNINAEIITMTQDEIYAYQFGNVLDSNGIRDYDCLVTTWGADYPDPSANLDPLFNIANIGAGGYNCAAYSNEEVDRLLTQAVTTIDESERMDLLMEACDLIIADEPYYVYSYPKGFAAFNKNWTMGDMNYTCAWDWNFKNVVYNG